jgi:hypothetical protein
MALNVSNSQPLQKMSPSQKVGLVFRAIVFPFPAASILIMVVIFLFQWLSDHRGGLRAFQASDEEDKVFSSLLAWLIALLQLFIGAPSILILEHLRCRLRSYLITATLVSCPPLFFFFREIDFLGYFLFFMLPIALCYLVSYEFASWQQQKAGPSPTANDEGNSLSQ